MSVTLLEAFFICTALLDCFPEDTSKSLAQLFIFFCLIWQYSAVFFFHGIDVRPFQMFWTFENRTISADLGRLIVSNNRHDVLSR